MLPQESQIDTCLEAGKSKSNTILGPRIPAPRSAARRCEAPRRTGAAFRGDREREPADDAVRISLGGAVDRASCECGGGVAVDGSVVALAIGAVALREAHEAWRGETCGCC